MRYLTVLVAGVLLASCVPSEGSGLSLHDIALYGDGGDTLYGYFYGEPTTLQFGDRTLVLTEGTAIGPLVVPSALLVNGAPYLEDSIAALPLPPPFEVTRDRLSTDISLVTRASTGPVVYFDGDRWFTLADATEAGFDTTVRPRERIDGLRGLGGLTLAEARVFEQALSDQGPLALAVISPRIDSRRVGGINNYRNTALYVQQDIDTNFADTVSPVQEVRWEVAASGNQAVAGDGRQFVIVSSQARLVSLWNQAYGNRLTPPPLPDVDFRRESVVGMFLGTQSTGGYGIGVQQVTLEDGDIYVTVDVSEPGPNAIVTQAFTSPWVLIRVGEPNVEVAWFREADNNDLIGVARRNVR